jgi:hypothetical protein
VTSPTPTPEGNPNPAPTPDPKNEPKPERPAITPEVQKLIDDAAKGARMEGERLGKKAAEDAIAAQAEADRIKRENDEAIKRGEFETVRTTLEGQVTTLTDEKKSLSDRITSYEKELGPIVEERLKPFEALNDADLMADFPKDGDALSKLAWLNDPWKQRAIKDIEAKQSTLRTWKNTPNPSLTKPTDDDAKRGQARMYRDF